MQSFTLGSGGAFFGTEDFLGNSGFGRIVLLCGSKARVRLIGERLRDTFFREHPRGYDLLKGTYVANDGTSVDLAVICTGIGSPSLDCLLPQLYGFGANKFIRVGTCGSLQSHRIKTGSIVVARAAVRDESTSAAYICETYPAFGSPTWLAVAEEISSQESYIDHVFHGVVHTKDSLYAREYGLSFRSESEGLMTQLRKVGVLATDMETSHLYILSSILPFTQEQVGSEILSISLLAVVGDTEPFSKDTQLVGKAEASVISLSLDFALKVTSIHHKRKADVSTT